MTESIRIVLGDDHEMVREGLAQVLTEREGFEVVGQAPTGAGVLSLVDQTHPDVAVLDYTMPEMDGTEVARQLSDSHGDTHVVILSMHENVHYAVHALQSGAKAYVVKSQPFDDLIDAIRIVKNGKTYVSPTLSGEVAQHLSVPLRKRATIDRLSRREFELLRLLGRGHPLKECARLMNISESTASTYRQRIVSKLGLESTASLIRFALEHGIDG